MPGLHPLLGESAGRRRTVDALIHPRVPIWLHTFKQMDEQSSNYRKLQGAGPEADAIVMLLFSGDVPAIVNVGEFSADGGHLRSGLPRYTLAATYYAVLFREHPGKVDWNIFQDRSNYDSGKLGFYVHQPDLGVLLEITPERARIVNETVWEVVTNHPHTAMKR
jgi:hypothetical protein